MTRETTFKIPRKGGANVAFLGAELKDAVPVLASVFIGIFCGSALGWGNLGYLGIPFAGYFLNRMYIDWQSKTLPGAFRNFLFSKGLAGYSQALKSQQTVFKGDGLVINPGTSQRIDHAVDQTQKKD
jgi:hypothetical protein